ncbi:HAMP domain-containing protein [Tardiphaga alba]|uniref:HAMP domain-containing protein n=1 Tax=Tardiphaga alba TaxID=340268 RepID=A0ABX8A4E8_9BRAD|nr:histidine kinase [Tardiphaga alba]QUS38252.1 HAMP domain-containing protein [Tardiphaga alba]
MWQNLSLRARINLLVAVVLALGLIANIARLALDAAPRVEAEDQSVIRLTREFIETIGPSLSGTQNADARLDEIVADLNRLRHVSIVRQSEESAPSAKSESRDRHDAVGSPPSWFVSLIHRERTSVPVSVTIGGKREVLTITSHPDDEMQEIWDGIVTQLALGLIVALALFAVTSLVIKRALAPLDALAQAMGDIEVGNYQTRVAPAGAPELAALCTRINHLAVTLDGVLEDRRRLAERSVSLQDQERKEIARELHDEFGPYLFAMRAHAGALMRLAGQDPADNAALSKHGAAILTQVDALQQFNRRILERLRPVGLTDLGLAGAIGVLLRLWRESRPDVVIEARIAPELARFGEVAELTAYRLVQEALTNVFRHAQATQVTVTITPLQQKAATTGHGSVSVRIQDNGRGLDRSRNGGLGLLGMRERVWALSGTLAITSDADGVIVEAIIPVMQQWSDAPALQDREFVPTLSGK